MTHASKAAISVAVGATAGGGGIGDVVLFMRSSALCASVFERTLEGFSRSA